MSSYHKVLVKDTDLFAVQNFPALEVSLQQISEQMKLDPLQASTDMLLSFVTEHRLDGKLANAYPQLAMQLTSHSIPIGELEDLFEASSNNPFFKKELEDHVRNALQVAAAKQNTDVHLKNNKQ